MSQARTATDLRIVLAMQESPVQIYIANELQRNLPIAAILVEQPPNGALRRLRGIARRKGLLRAGARAVDLLYLRAWARRSTRREIATLFAAGAPVRLSGPAPVHIVPSVNAPAARRLLSELRPDILIINGTSIVRSSVIEVARVAAVNLHTGIVPDFRGCTPEFWALYHDRPEGVGVTIHHLVPEIDGGDVILMERTPVQPDDDDVSLRCRNARAGARMLAEAVRMLGRGDAPRRPQDSASGAYFSHRSCWQDMALRWRLRRARAGDAAGRGGAERGQDA